MRIKNMKKMISFTLSTAMVMGMSMTAFAEDPVSVTAPIYSYDITSVVVPTSYAVAFNPNGLDVTVDSDGTTDNAQVLSKNYGIINKSTKDKIITVALSVEDLNTDKITFVDSAAKVTSASKDEYAVYLAATPADSATEVQVGATPASADKDTTGADLADVTMSKATGKDVALQAGTNQIGFKLSKAVYSLKDDADLTLGTTTENDVKDLFDVSALAAAGKGITAFTFTGAVNDKADWTKLTSGIKITPVYTSANVTGDETDITGTSMVELDAAPSVASDVTYNRSTGGDLVVPCNLGIGESKATAVTDVAVTGGDGNFYSVNGIWGTVKVPTLSITGSSFTITEGWIDNVANGTYKAYVMFDDDTAGVLVNITIAD